MAIFDLIRKQDHQAVVFCSDPETGLRAIIAIHDTSLGPALGGCRMKSYATEQDALVDVLNLSRAMTYKASAAGLNLGGGKSVVMLDHPSQKTPALLKAFAERIALLKGTYIGAGDVGSNTDDLKIMHQYCPHIVGLSKEDGGLGDSAILTSLGVFMGLKAAVVERLGQESMEGIRVAVQGAGKVGYHLVGHLLEAGCHVLISDPNDAAVQHIKDAYPAVEMCPGEALYEKEVDIFSPNAIGGLLTQEVARFLKAKIVAGGANNPLGDELVATILHQRNILYAPDFVINAGGLMMVAAEIQHVTFEQAEAQVRGIYDKTREVFEYAKSHQMLPWNAAQAIAMHRIDNARKQKGLAQKARETATSR